MHPPMRFDYTTLGHVTVDLMADGSRRPGGGAFYSALQAARLGLKAQIVTQGSPTEIEELLAPYAAELELHVRPAPHTTTLATSGRGDGRHQRLLSWAGPIASDVRVDTTILHLAPVARETGASWRGRPGFTGLTAQGLTRGWPAGGGDISQVALEPRRVPARCDAIVISVKERASCAWLLAGADDAQSSAGARAPSHSPRPRLVAVTARGAATELHVAGGEVRRVPVPATEAVVDDLGAGDVFAAAFFIALHDGSAPVQATRFAHAAAAVRIGAAGPQAVGRRAAIAAQLSSRP
jgi:sugar/nucleoside kinase (ribokinase family)